MPTCHWWWLQPVMATWDDCNLSCLFVTFDDCNLSCLFVTFDDCNLSCLFVICDECSFQKGTFCTVDLKTLPRLVSCQSTSLGTYSWQRPSMLRVLIQVHWKFHCFLSFKKATWLWHLEWFMKLWLLLNMEARYSQQNNAKSWSVFQGPSTGLSQGM